MRLCTPTVLFVGWFGPRGITPILYALLIVRQAQIPSEQTGLAADMSTVLLSGVLHGVTAVPGAAVHAAAVYRQPPDAAEHQEIQELPLRLPAAGVTKHFLEKGTT